MRGSTSALGVGAVAVVAAFVACTSFGSKDDVTPPATDDAGFVDRGTDSATDAPAKRCGDSRSSVLRCGANVVCDAGDHCCVNGADVRTCLPGNCPGTQMNCQGNADCPKGNVCCQAGTFIGSQCLTACEPDKLRYCYTSDECGPGEGCVPFDDAGFGNVWRCAPCP